MSRPCKAQLGTHNAHTRGPKPKDNTPQLTNTCPMIIADTSSGYHNLKLDEKSYLTTYACQFGRYRFTRLPFEVAPADMFQQKTNKTF